LSVLEADDMIILKCIRKISVVLIGTAFLILYIGTVGLTMNLGGFRKEYF